MERISEVYVSNIDLSKEIDHFRGCFYYNLDLYEHGKYSSQIDGKQDGPQSKKHKKGLVFHQRKLRETEQAD